MSLGANYWRTPFFEKNWMARNVSGSSKILWNIIGIIRWEVPFYFQHIKYVSTIYKKKWMRAKIQLNPTFAIWPDFFFRGNKLYSSLSFTLSGVFKNNRINATASPPSRDWVATSFFQKNWMRTWLCIDFENGDTLLLRCLIRV